MYYTDLVLSSQGKGIEHAIAAAESITLDGVKEHHQRLISNSASVECLFGGNVGERDAKEFFTRSQDLITTARTSSSQKPQKWIPGKITLQGF
jgi:secreted Zn-dependent insulinase-like peptidase